MRKAPDTQRSATPPAVVFSHEIDERPISPPGQGKDGARRASLPAFLSASVAADDGESGT